MIRDASFSAPGMREMLLRQWDETLPMGVFIGVNPSVADAARDDATARRYLGFATRWNWGGYVAGNLWQIVETDVRALVDRICGGDPDRPVNPPEPDQWLHQLRPKVVCCAWGNCPPRIAAFWQRRCREVRAAIEAVGAKAVCAGTNLSGEPCHLSRLGYGDSALRGPMPYAFAYFGAR